MIKREPAPHKTPAAAALLCVLLVAVLAAAWWKGIGPFRNDASSEARKEPPRLNLMKDVKYIDPRVILTRFADFRDSYSLEFAGGKLVETRRLNEIGAKNKAPGDVFAQPPEQPQWLVGEEVPSLPPYLRSSSDYYNGPRTKKESLETAALERTFTIATTAAMQDMGFSPPPYATPIAEFSTRQQETISEASYATMRVVIQTYKTRSKVWFQVETRIEGHILARGDKPALVPTMLGLCRSPLYSVSADDAVRATEAMLRQNVHMAIGDVSKPTKPAGARRELQINPDYLPARRNSTVSR